MPYLVTDTGVVIYDGSVIVMSSYPNVKWILKNGWYTYQGRQYNGWYASSIPENNILPIDEQSLVGVTLISSPGCSCSPPPPFPPGPGCIPPPPPQPDFPFHKDLKDQIERAWITVDTIEQRNRLNIHLVPNGKVVKVNNVDGQVKYYSYDQVNSTWVEELFGLDGQFIKKSELDDEISQLIQQDDSSTQSIIKEVARKSVTWSQVKE